MKDKNETIKNLLFVVLMLLLAGSIFIYIDYGKEYKRLEAEGVETIGVVTNIYIKKFVKKEYKIAFVVNGRIYHDWSVASEETYNYKRGEIFVVKYLPDNPDVSDVVSLPNFKFKRPVMTRQDSCKLDTLRLFGLYPQ